MEYTVDAKGKTIGRSASEAAKLLMGKNKATFERNKISGNKVTITNAAKAKINEKRMESTFHEKYSGYPGGFKLQSIKDIISKKGHRELFKLAVYGMLPANRLRNPIMKNLKITD